MIHGQVVDVYIHYTPPVSPPLSMGRLSARIFQVEMCFLFFFFFFFYKETKSPPEEQGNVVVRVSHYVVGSLRVMRVL